MTIDEAGRWAIRPFPLGRKKKKIGGRFLVQGKEKGKGRGRATVGTKQKGEPMCARAEESINRKKGTSR